MNLEEYFSQEYIVVNLAKYEMYYQVALGRLINGINNPKEMSYDIEFQLALGSIYELLKDLESLENKDELFETELRKQSAMDAVQNFVNEHLERVKEGEIQVESIVNEINDELFFNDAMMEICSNNLYAQVSKWEGVITSELADAILVSLKDLEGNHT